MKSLGWALTQYDWCANKKRKSGHRRTQRKDNEKTRVEMVVYMSKREVLRRHQPCQPLDFELRVSAPARK